MKRFVQLGPDTMMEDAKGDWCRVSEMEDLLRWRDIEKEKPAEFGEYLVRYHHSHDFWIVTWGFIWGWVLALRHARTAEHQNIRAKPTTPRPKPSKPQGRGR